MRLVFLGPPGAGKGTQAERLAAAKGLLHLSTGDILRHAISQGTPTGLRAKGHMDKGELVPDDVVDAVVEERLAQDDAQGGFLLDGYPRNLAQAHALARFLANAGRPLTGVLYLAVDEEELVTRILKRGRDSGRADDAEDVVRERLRVYEEHTAPLVDHYGAQGLLRRIDGNRSIEDVAQAVATAAEGLAA